MRVLLTGGTGFFGSHLARALVERGDELSVLRRHASSLARLADLTDHIEQIAVEDGVDAALAHGPFDVVVHSATCYGRLGESDASVCESNVGWPSRLLAAAARSGVPLFVNTDTSLPPSLTPYARTKRTFADHACGVTRDGEIAVLNVRLESVYGPGDDAGKFNTQLLHAMLRDVPTFALTPGQQCRDFIYVEDAANAYVRLIDHAHRCGEQYLSAGVGRGVPVSIRTLAETVKRLAGAHTRLEFGALPYRDGELMSACADIALLHALGWTAARDLETGLGETVERERALLAGAER
jgi:nucleoside-diphosphate-sugar epimerase